MTEGIVYGYAVDGDGVVLDSEVKVMGIRGLAEALGVEGAEESMEWEETGM
jgi:hypothetical protein